MKTTKWFAIAVVMVLVILFVVVISEAQTPRHNHRIKDLRPLAVKVLDIEKGQIVFLDLEEDEEAVVKVHRFDIDPVLFRFVEFKEGKTGDNGNFSLLGLGALKTTEGILSYCAICGKAVGVRFGKVNFYAVSPKK